MASPATLFLFLAAVALADAVGTMPSASVTIHASTITHTINPLFLGCHSDSRGFLAGWKGVRTGGLRFPSALASLWCRE